MLKIRLKRVGRKHDPSFRLVVLESTRGPKSGDYIENLGSYNARTDEKTIKNERVSYWLGVGAKPSDTVHNLLVELGTITGKKINVLPKKTPLVKENTEKEKVSKEETSEESEPVSESISDNDSDSEENIAQTKEEIEVKSEPEETKESDTENTENKK